MEQVKFASKQAWSPSGAREPTHDQWTKAIAFRQLFASDCIRSCDSWYVCHARRSGCVADRDGVKVADARWAVDMHLRLLAGKIVPWRDLDRFVDEFRVFNDHKCTCFAYRPTKLCHHVLGSALFHGTLQVPLEYDGTKLETAARGRRVNAPRRYMAPFSCDAKDKETQCFRSHFGSSPIPQSGSSPSVTWKAQLGLERPVGSEHPFVFAWPRAHCELASPL